MTDATDRAIAAACDLTQVHAYVDIATSEFVVAITNGGPWLDRIPPTELERLAEDTARLEQTILRLLAMESRSVALQTLKAGTLARRARAGSFPQSRGTGVNMADEQDRDSRLAHHFEPRLRARRLLLGGLR